MYNIFIQAVASNRVFTVQMCIVYTKTSVTNSVTKILTFVFTKFNCKKNTFRNTGN